MIKAIFVMLVGLYVLNITSLAARIDAVRSIKKHSVQITNTMDAAREIKKYCDHCSDCHVCIFGTKDGTCKVTGDVPAFWKVD